MKNLIMLAGLITVTSPIFASSNNDPHFNIVMENRSDKDASISFQKEVGNVDLSPALADHTPLSAHTKSLTYGVNFHPLESKDTFNVIFTGKRNCTFNVAFYGPANPKVTVSGPGCYGGGYSIVDGGETLLLYISDIHVK